MARPSLLSLSSGNSYFLYLNIHLRTYELLIFSNFIENFFCSTRRKVKIQQILWQVGFWGCKSFLDSVCGPVLNEFCFKAMAPESGFNLRGPVPVIWCILFSCLVLSLRFSHRLIAFCLVPFSLMAHLRLTTSWGPRVGSRSISWSATSCPCPTTPAWWHPKRSSRQSALPAPARAPVGMVGWGAGPSPPLLALTSLWGRRGRPC